MYAIKTSLGYKFCRRFEWRTVPLAISLQRKRPVILNKEMMSGLLGPNDSDVLLSLYRRSDVIRNAIKIASLAFMQVNWWPRVSAKVQITNLNVH